MKYLNEVFAMMKTFFCPGNINFDELKIEREVKKFGRKIGFLNFFQMALAIGFSFMLKTSNMLIEKKMVLIGVSLFIIYKLEGVIRDLVGNYINSSNEVYRLIYDNQKTLKGSEIVGEVSNRVYKFNKNKGTYMLMSNEEIISSLSNYIDNLWNFDVNHVFDVISMMSVIVMLTISVITNTEVNQWIYIPLLLFFAIINFILVANISIRFKNYYQESFDKRKQQETIKNDLLRVSLIVNKDLEMRIEKFRKLLSESSVINKTFTKNRNRLNFIGSSVGTLGEVAIILMYLINTGLSNITLATIAEITGNLVIYITSMRKIAEIANTIRRSRETIVAMETEKENVNTILKVYNSQKSKSENSQPVDRIVLNPFEIKYEELSENDKPFTLVSRKPILIGREEIAILYGPSGSGKSTFMKMLTERIKLQKDTDLPSTDRYLYFDESLRFGSLSIFEELFLDYEPDYSKMKFILENLGLWSEISRNCTDNWKWMKEKNFHNSLSNGQKQRMILAKLMYWLDERIDVVVFDECTSGLDESTEDDSVDAQKILDFIVRYVNRDKKRIVILSTHQSIEAFKDSIKKGGVTVREFTFSRVGDCNYVNEK